MSDYMQKCSKRDGGDGADGRVMVGKGWRAADQGRMELMQGKGEEGKRKIGRSGMADMEI
jgi:hypothetical protein